MHTSRSSIVTPARAAAILSLSLLLPPAVAHAQSYTFKPIALFSKTTGTGPVGGVVEDAFGNLFGATADMNGSLFEIAAGTTNITTLATFPLGGSAGIAPYFGVCIDPTGDLFGTVILGGSGTDGTAFELAAGSSNAYPLVAFNANIGGPSGGGLALDSQGNLFGTTVGRPGTYPFGMVFELPAATRQFTPLASFNGANGQNPNGSLLLDPSGNLFGTASGLDPTGGDSTVPSEVFEIASGSNQITPLSSLDPSNIGVTLTGLVRDSAGNLYGTTVFGPNVPNGTVFEVPAGGGTASVIAVFNKSNGSDPRSPLTIDSHGNLFGTTLTAGTLPDGSAGFGTVFEIPAGTSKIVTLHTFSGTDGTGPTGALLIDDHGNIFGTAGGGGNDWDPSQFEPGDGVVFELSPVPLGSILSFSPAAGIPGTLVKIVGTGFTGATGVSFNGTPAKTFAVTSATIISAIVPAGASGAGPISMTLPGGTVSSAKKFTIYNRPAITSLAPTAGPTGAKVVVTGSGFTGATMVTFNGTRAGFTAVNDTTLNTTVPPGATSGQLTVNGPAGAATIFFAVTPGVTSFTPIIGPVGAAVTITGTTLAGATSVSFHGTNATSFTVNSPTSITTTVPAGATTGPISVTTLSGTGTSVKNFTVAPDLIGFTISPGTAIPGTTVTGTLTLDGPAPTVGSRIEISYLGLPYKGVTVPAGATGVTFTLPIPASVPAGVQEFSASYFSVTLSATVTVTPTDTLVGLSLSPSSISAGGATTATITLGQAAPKNLSVTVSLNGYAVAAIPVKAGATTGSVVIATNSTITPGMYTLTAAYQDTTASTLLTVTP